VVEGEVGEMYLRIIYGKWVLTWFNAGEYRVDILRRGTDGDRPGAAPHAAARRGEGPGAQRHGRPAVRALHRARDHARGAPPRVLAVADRSRLALPRRAVPLRAPARRRLWRLSGGVAIGGRI